MNRLGAFIRVRALIAGRRALDYGCAMLIDRNDLPNDLFGIPELDLSGGLCAEVKGAPEAAASYFSWRVASMSIILNLPWSSMMGVRLRDFRKDQPCLFTALRARASIEEAGRF
jgi:hypothetical protein